jgi:hypothetical protein
MPITIPQPTPGGITTAGLDTTGLLAINPDQLEIDMYPDIFWIDRGATPILTLLAQKLRSRPAFELETKWLEDAPIPRNLTASGSFTMGAGTITLTAGQGQYNNPGDLWKDTLTGELMLVVSIATDTVTITRGYAGSTAAASSGTADTILNMGNVSGHGTTSPAALQTTKTTKSNFCSIRKHAVQVTKTLEAVKTYGGSERQYQRVKKAQEHATDWEQMLLHGFKGSVTASNNPAYTTGGLDFYVTSNVLSVTGTLTEATWLDFLPQVFRFCINAGSRRKILFASAELINTINSWGLSKLQVTPASERLSQTYGIDIKEYVCGFGKLYVTYHPLLSFGYLGYGYVLDLDGLELRPLRPTTLETNIQANDADFFKDQYLTECGYMVAEDVCHGIVKGVLF